MPENSEKLFDDINAFLTEKREPSPKDLYRQIAKA